MRAVNLTVKRTRESSDSRDKRQAFWAGLEMRYSNAETDLDSLENKLRNRFPRHLTELVQRALSSAWTEERSDRDGRFYSQRVEHSEALRRVIFRIQKISYGSLKIELGVPDPEAIFDALGTNIEVLEALLESYVPEAFAHATDTDVHQFQFEAEASRELVELASSRSARVLPTIRETTASSPAPEIPKEDAKQRGAKIAAELVRSPLIFPVLLICFLWYIARQDTLAERQIVSGLMQALIQQQTATTTVLRDVALKVSEPGAKQSTLAKNPTPTAPDEKH